MKQVGFQGVKGAYSEAAAYAYFHDESIKTVGFDVSEQVCDALENGDIDFAILPVENSIVGNVSVNMDLLYHRNVQVIGEYYLPIMHCLIGLPGATKNELRSVSSHPVALAQCRDFIQAHGLKGIPAFDTAGACMQLSRQGRPSKGAIASELSAHTYGLEVLQKNIAKTQRNITRFQALARSNRSLPERKQEKTSLVFATHHKPGALLDALQVFRNFDINLTRLESKPMVENPFAYSFFVDFHGGISDQYIQLALKKLSVYTTHIKVLGSYPEGKKPN